MSDQSTSRNSALFARAQRVLPGGVNSPVRAFRAVGGEPLVIRSAAGSHLEDENGKHYLDFVGSWGPLILGHAHPEVVAAIREAVGRGTTFGAPCAVEIELAERIVDCYPGIEQIRCVSSGTEATMSAIRLARGVTGRDLIVKFAGCYHGHADHLLVEAGSGLVTFGTPSSDGVPEEFVKHTLVLPLDDPQRLQDLLRREGDRIAAVIVEPIPANNGLLLQRPEFLQALRAETSKAGALLIFDEVVSGFRIRRGGAAELYGITPDIACFGKVIGGGMPVGAFGSSREVMSHLAPQGGVYQAGTLSGNPVAMTAGLTTLAILERDDAWQRLEQLGRYLSETMAKVLAEAPIPAQFVRIGSIFWIALHAERAPRTAEAIPPAAADSYRTLFHQLLEQGITIAPSAYEVGFLSTAHTEADVDTLGDAVARALLAHDAS